MEYIGSTVSYKFVLFCHSLDIYYFLLILNILSLIWIKVSPSYFNSFFYVFSLPFIQKTLKYAL